ncbi:retrovirus-related pol polyprotein from transposon TNT 1-94, partial [Tanacetum coccineum]
MSTRITSVAIRGLIPLLCFFLSFFQCKIPSFGVLVSIPRVILLSPCSQSQAFDDVFYADMVKDVARDKLDAKSVKCTFIGYGSDEMGYHFWDSKSHKVVRSRDVTFNKDSLYGAKAATYSSNLTKPNQKDQVVLEDSPDNLANKSIVTEHGLSSEITQSPSGSLDASEGSENSGSFEDSRRSDEEDSEDRASSEEGGSETPQLRRSTRESRAPKKAINEEMVSLEKNQTWSLVRLPARKKALQSKRVFRVKEEHDGKKRYK